MDELRGDGIARIIYCYYYLWRNGLKAGGDRWWIFCIRRPIVVNATALHALLFFITPTHTIQYIISSRISADKRLCFSVCVPSRFYLVIFITLLPRGDDRLREKLHKHRKPPISRTGSALPVQAVRVLRRLRLVVWSSHYMYIIIRVMSKQYNILLNVATKVIVRISLQLQIQWIL